MCACSFTNVCQRARERERERVERHIHTVINVCVFHMEQNNTISFKNTHVPIIWEYISLQSHSFIIYTGIVHVYIKSEKGERHYRRKCHQMIFFFFFFPSLRNITEVMHAAPCTVLVLCLFLVYKSSTQLSHYRRDGDDSVPHQNNNK